ncbi:hypothetical protein D9M69_457690 [compost metagenome]
MVGQKADVVEGQCGFAAALGMPDNPLLDAFIECSFDGLGGEELRVTHDVLV